jgi:hypothetical protein
METQRRRARRGCVCYLVHIVLVDDELVQRPREHRGRRLVACQDEGLDLQPSTYTLRVEYASLA